MVTLGHSIKSRKLTLLCPLGFPGGSIVKNPAANAGDMGLIPGLGRSSGEGNGSPLQYSCLEKPTERGAWRAAIHGVAKESEMKERLNNIMPASGKTEIVTVIL